MIDGVLFFVVFLILALATGGGYHSHGRTGAHLGGPGFLIWLGITFAYFFICEGVTGQTLGKRMVGIRVMSADGSQASWGQVAARNVLRFVDALPAFYVVGLIAVWLTGRERRQRVGDLAARTCVVGT